MKRFAIIVVVILAVSVCAIAQEKEKQQADIASQSWLALVDKGDYAASWQQAATAFKAAITKEQWGKALDSSRGQFGKVLSRKLKNATYSTTLPGAPDGKYVVILYETSFENKKASVETVTPMLDKDGQWHVSGYYIR
jgi:Protein of unknown function (DUF4019)